MFSISPLDVTEAKHSMNEPILDATREAVQDWFDAPFEHDQ